MHRYNSGGQPFCFERETLYGFEEIALSSAQCGSAIEKHHIIAIGRMSA